MNDSDVEVLLIDEDAADASSVIGMLAKARKDRFSVLHAENVSEAMTELKSRTFHVILLGTPLDSTGFGNALKVQNQAKHTPVVVLTPSEDEENIFKVSEIGIQDCLLKEEITSTLLIRSIQFARQRKRISDELQEREKRFRATFTHAAVGISHIAPDGKLLQINQKYSDIVGYTEEEIKKLSFQAFTHPEDQEISLKYFQSLLAGELQSYSLTKRYIRKDESIVWVKLTASMVFDEDGSPSFAIGCIEDITLRKQAEESLRFSEERYGALFRDIPVMIVTLDADFTMLSVNPACAQQLGYTIAELEGQSVLMLFWGDDHLAVADQLRQCLQNPYRTYSWQLRKISKSKEKLWVEEIAQAVYDPNGTLSILVVCQDITERKRADDVLRKSERFKQGVLDSLPEHIAVLDKDGIVISVNKSWTEFAEQNGMLAAASVCKGTDYLHICGKAAGMSDPLAQEALAGIEAVLTGKQEAFSLEYLCTLTTQEHWFIMQVVRPAYDFQGCVVIHLDITDQKRAEKEIRISEKNYRTIFDSGNDAFFIQSADTGRIIDVNQKMLQMYKYSYEQVLSLNVLDLCGDPKITEKDILQLVNAVKYEEPMVFEWLAKDQKGKLFWIEVSVKRILLKGEERLLSIARDISERKETEANMNKLVEQVTRSNRELEQFAYVASHDLQEPLRMVSSYVQLLKRKYQGKLDEKADTYINYALDGTNRMQNLIEGLLKYSRITTSELSPVDTSITFADATANLAAVIHESRAEVTSSNLPTVMGDSTQLLQLFQNLLSNALKYRRPDLPPRVTVAAEQVDGQWQFTVKDNGIGIAPENYGKVFEIFQRLHTKEEYPGTGIGLASCKKIVEQHHGRIWLESSPGRGTTFFFTLPMEGQTSKS